MSDQINQPFQGIMLPPPPPSHGGYRVSHINSSIRNYVNVIVFHQNQYGGVSHRVNFRLKQNELPQLHENKNQQTVVPLHFNIY